MKLVTIVGARPQFIKAAMLSHALVKHDDIDEVLIHTGQHYDGNMSDIFFNELKIPAPKYHLAINNLNHGHMTGQMLIQLEDIFLDEKPSAVLVYGDTNSTLAGALVAAKLHIPVIHIESGLRSYNKAMPEEINRILTDNISDVLFCPTQTAVDNLKKENITKNVFVTADIMQDAVNYARSRDCSKTHGLLKNLGVESKYIFLTLHREENTNNREKLQDLLAYTLGFANENQLDLIFALHPRTRKVCQNNNISLDGFNVCEPLGYFETQALIKDAAYVFTDSGGLQKEAYFHRVPCVTLRDETEWVETLECGWNRLWTSQEYKERKDIKDFVLPDNYSVSDSIIEKIKSILCVVGEPG